MAKCNLNAECYFLREATGYMPLTTEYVRTTYCNGAYETCTIYKVASEHGLDKVPGYVAPNDSFDFISQVVEHHLSRKTDLH